MTQKELQVLLNPPKSELGCVYCRTREFLREVLFRHRTNKTLKREILETQLDITAFRNRALRYFKNSDRGVDKRTFEETLTAEKLHLEMVRNKVTNG
jgi:hypothetical protein